MFPKRIFMNEVADPSPSGGGGTPAPEQPPAANGASQPAVVPVDQLKSVVTEVFGELKNGLFADLRRAGALKQDRPAEPKTPPAPQPEPAPATTGLSTAEVRNMLARDRILTRAAAENKLSDAQVLRIESALSGVGVEEFPSALQSYMTDMGLIRSADPAPVNPSPAPTGPVSTAPPISDKGSPAPGGVLDWEREFAENPIGMSPAARERMNAKHGEEKARKMRLQAAQRQAERIRVTKPQG